MMFLPQPKYYNLKNLKECASENSLFLKQNL